MAVNPLSIDQKRITLHKALMNPIFGQRNVLTNSPWTFVDLWLRREGQDAATFYWEQARQLYEASTGLPMQSAPLLLYYAFMNASKALLEAKGISYMPRHGVREAQSSLPNRKLSLASLKVIIQQSGILPSVSAYFQETEANHTHAMEDLLYNLPFIHRTYCLTYTSRGDMFFPLRNCEYARNDETGEVFFRGEFASDISAKPLRNKLPATIIMDPDRPGAIRSADQVFWSHANKASSGELSSLIALHQKLRADLYYINGSQTLWYLRTTGKRRLSRRSPTIVLAAMHRLSEICRYRPIELVAFMNGQRNWILSEFVAMAPAQFFDEVAAEITGYQFLVPNVRAPS